MRIDLTVRDRGGSDRDVAVTAPDRARFVQIKTDLARLVGAAADATWWSGCIAVRDDDLLGSGVLSAGSVLAPIPPEGAARERSALLRLQVIGGPNAGRSVPLARGALSVGRAPTCDLALADPDISRRHLSLTITADGIRVVDLNSTNGTSIDGDPIGPRGASVHEGAVIRIGDSFLSVHRADESAAVIRPGPGGALVLNRPPRIHTETVARVVAAPTPPSPAQRARTPWLAAAVPVLGAGVLTLVLHSVQFLLLVLLSPLALVVTTVADGWHRRRDQRRAAADFAVRSAAAEAEIAEALCTEAAERRRAAPDAATVERLAATRSARLWERRVTDPDVLHVRLGLADLESHTQRRDGSITAAAGRVAAVPATVDLRNGPLGIAAPRAVGLAVARWLVTQLAVLHGPSDVEIVALLADGIEDDWSWLRWLPHLGRRVASDAEQRAAVVTELGRLVEHRRDRERRGGSRWTGPWLVLLVDEVHTANDLAGLSLLMRFGPAVGVSAIHLDRRRESLPPECAAMARAVGETGSRLQLCVAGSADTLVVADQVSGPWSESVARALTPFIDAHTAASSAVPQHCRLVDLIGLPRPDAASVLARWASSDATPAVPVGVGSTGPVVVDLVEDGPHALIAGTTGSGKSELLQTLVAALAVSHPPADISFLLVDYKGGAAFGPCVQLPHVAGVLTDLDAHLTARALRSLECELRRREELFAQVGAGDLATYRAACGHQQPVARLVIVIDEFAALVEDQPEFLTGLIGVAQRGRSLGLHLVLATQRPGGVVSPEIRANTSLRIALRVADAAESTDVIGSGDAASIDHRTPGRAFVRTGTALTEMQTARVSAPPSTEHGPATRVEALDRWRRLEPPAADPTAQTSDLDVIVQVTRAAARRAGMARVPQPWLAPLPSRICVDDLPSAARVADIPFALADLPDRQQQCAATVDLDAGGGILYAGAARSGRTSTLITVAVSAAARLSPDQLHIQAIDGAGGALRALCDLPHVGTVADTADFAVVETLLRRLAAELSRRRAQLAESGFACAAEARAAGHTLPSVLFLLDGWEGFLRAAEDYDAGLSTEALLALVRSGAAAGITTILTGDRGVLAPRVAGAVPERYLLRLADRADYALAGLAPRAVPAALPPGRAIRAGDGAEIQVALAGTGPERTDQRAAVAALAARYRLPSATPLITSPIRIRQLPSRLARSQVPMDQQGLRLGVGGDAGEPITLDLWSGAGRLLIAGPPRSGRSTALHTLLLDAVASNRAVRLAAPPRSPLTGAAAAAGLDLITPSSPAGVASALMADGRPGLLLIDDCEAFADTAVGDAVTELVRTAPSGLAVVAAVGSDELALSFRGLATELRRRRCALLLQPRAVDGELIGRRLPRSPTSHLPGRGLLAGDPAWGALFADGPVPIQVATP